MGHYCGQRSCPGVLALPPCSCHQDSGNCQGSHLWAWARCGSLRAAAPGRERSSLPPDPPAGASVSCRRGKHGSHARCAGQMTRPHSRRPLLHKNSSVGSRSSRGHGRSHAACSPSRRPHGRILSSVCPDPLIPVCSDEWATVSLSASNSRARRSNCASCSLTDLRILADEASAAVGLDRKLTLCCWDGISLLILLASQRPTS